MKANEVVLEFRVNHILYQITQKKGEFKARYLSGFWHYLDGSFASVDDAVKAAKKKEL